MTYRVAQEAAHGDRPTLVSVALPYLATRFTEGCASAQCLRTEVIARGARVSERTGRRSVQRLRVRSAPAAPPQVPKVREVTSLLLKHPDALGEEDRLLLKELCDRCPELDRARHLMARFSGMVVTRSGAHRLHEWVRDARDSSPGEQQVLTEPLVHAVEQPGVDAEATVADAGEQSGFGGGVHAVAKMQRADQVRRPGNLKILPDPDRRFVVQLPELDSGDVG